MQALSKLANTQCHHVHLTLVPASLHSLKLICENMECCFNELVCTLNIVRHIE